MAVQSMFVPPSPHFCNWLTPSQLLYSFPIPPSSESTIHRLSTLAKGLGPHGLSVMIDHPAQIPALESIHSHSGSAPDVFLKIDMGGHRAGVEPNSPGCASLIHSLLTLHSSGTIHLLGLYSHAGQSYSATSQASALDYLRQEFEALLSVSTTIHSLSHPLVLSVGATPTTTSIRNLLIPDANIHPEARKEISALRGTITTIRDSGCTLEIHAGKAYSHIELLSLQYKPSSLSCLTKKGISMAQKTGSKLLYLFSVLICWQAFTQHSTSNNLPPTPFPLQVRTQC
jgi:hypothetical protein